MIGDEVIYENTFDGDGPLPPELTVWGQFDPATPSSNLAFAIVSGRLRMTAGSGPNGLKTARLPAAMFGNGKYAIEFETDEAAGTPFMGGVLRMSTPVDASCNGYVLGKNGSKVFINRIVGGVPVDPPLLNEYSSALEVSPFRLRIEVDTDDNNNPVLRVLSRPSVEEPFVLRGEVIDSSAEKITDAGTAAFATITYYDGPTRYQTWDNVRVLGTPAVADTTPPELSAISAAATGATTATVTVTTDEGKGTLYAVLTGSATPPTAAQIRLGQDHEGAAAAWSGNQSVASVGAKNFNAGGLTAGATLYPHSTQRDLANNDAAVVTGAALTLPTVPVLTLNGDNTLIEGEAIALEGANVDFTGATELYLRHGALRMPQADLVVVDADSATADYVGALGDIGMPFTTAQHVVYAGLTIDEVDYEVAIDHQPAAGVAHTINPSTVAVGNGSLFKSLMAWFTSQSLVPSSQDQCTVADEISGTPTSWVLDGEGNLTGYIEEGPQTGTATALYWLASNSTLYEIPMTLVDGEIDTIAPHLIVGPLVSEITQTTATLSATPDDDGHYAIAVLLSGALPPNGPDILAGTASAAVWSQAATAMTANGAFQVPMSTLQAGASYRAHVALRDAAGNTRVVTSSPWTMVASDTTAPDLTAGVSITAITQITATLSATPTEAGEYGIAVLLAAAAAPGATPILGGAVAGSVWTRSATAMAAGVAFSGAMNNMEAGKQYRAHIGLRDAAGNTRVVTSNPWTMKASSSDTIAPNVVAGPGVANLHPAGFDITFTTDEAGQYRIALLAVGAGVPSAAEVLAGTGAAGAAPIAASNLLAMVAGVPVSTQFSNLQANDAHVPYLALRDAAGNTRRLTAGTVTTPPVPDIEHPGIAIGAVAQGENHLVTAAVTDNIGVVGVQFFVNGQSIGAELVNPPWQWLWQTAGYPNGAYVITAQARDGSGNTTLSNSVLVQINRDSAPAGAPLSRRGGRTYEQRGATWFEVEDR